MSYQDWKPVVLTKNRKSAPKGGAALASAQNSGQVQTQKKWAAGLNHAPSVHNARRLDEETETFKHVRVTHSFKVALMKARQAKKLTQAQLAQKLNVKQTVINEYESGKAIPNGQIINKLNRVLGVKLPKIPKPKKNKNKD
eukprot:TRINITY_DN66350_c7_g1_i1.p1 TRINITY_DN66350_c7_g1~~TRINITY_DN66350_c7_g1_i1.p1  ORF type:complete len:141 (-),score=71.74 TRINITY_DN66350_c7_g1_i1:49-471(-)